MSVILLPDDRVARMIACHDDPVGPDTSPADRQLRVDATARAVIDSAPDAIVAFDTDRTVLLWNPAAERMFGWSAGRGRRA